MQKPLIPLLSGKPFLVCCLLRAGDNPFAYFFSSYFELAHDCPEFGRTAQTPWPLPLPYFGASCERKMTNKCSGSDRNEEAVQAAVYLLVAALS